jgi:hypothetical protein
MIKVIKIDFIKPRFKSYSKQIHTKNQPESAAYELGEQNNDPIRPRIHANDTLNNQDWA